MSTENQEKRGCLPLENYWMMSVYTIPAGLYLMYNAQNEQQFILGISLVILGISVSAKDYLKDLNQK